MFRTTMPTLLLTLLLCPVSALPAKTLQSTVPASWSSPHNQNGPGIRSWWGWDYNMCEENTGICLWNGVQWEEKSVQQMVLIPWFQHIETTFRVATDSMHGCIAWWQRNLSAHARAVDFMRHFVCQAKGQRGKPFQWCSACPFHHHACMHLCYETVKKLRNRCA